MTKPWVQLAHEMLRAMERVAYEYGASGARPAARYFATKFERKIKKLMAPRP